MCKYCKNLKRIKDLDEKEYIRIINHWRRRDLEGRKLLSWCLSQLEILRFTFSDRFEVSDLSDSKVDWSYGAMIDDIKRFIGK